MAFKLHPDAKTKGKIEFDDKKVITAEFRVSYPALFEPKEFKGKKSYSVQMLFDKETDLSELEVAAHNAAIEEWGSDTSKWPSKKIKSKKTGKIINKSLVKMPFRDGDIEKPDSPEYEGMTFVGASCSKRAPEVLDQKRKLITEDDGTLKAGDYARAKIVASAYDVEGSVGVKFTLLAIQKLRTGEALGGGRSAADEFDDGYEIDEDEEAEDMEDESDENEDEDEEDEKPSKSKSKKKSPRY